MFQQLYPITVDKPAPKAGNPLPAGLEALSRKSVRAAWLRYTTKLEEKCRRALSSHGLEDDATRLDALKQVVMSARRQKQHWPAEELAKLAALPADQILLEKSAPPFSLREAIAQRKQAEKSDHLHRHDTLFGDRWRLYYRLLPDNSRISQTQKEVAAQMAADGFDQMDYAKGTVIDASGQTRKIGRVLRQSNPDLGERFAKDDTRGSARQMLVLSRHPYDLARMSTARGWQSCMTKEGAYWEKAPAEWEHGSVIAYLTSVDDPNIMDPQARMLFKPFVNDAGETVLQPYDTYGINSGNFRQSAIALIEHEYNRGKLGRFKLPYGIYRDMKPDRCSRVSAAMSASDFLLAVTGQRPVERVDGTLLHKGDLDFTYYGLSELPDLSKVEVAGHLVLRGNGLTSLKGAPYKVGRKCDVSGNKLVTLEGAPQEVGSFDCSDNHLISLKGGPVKCGLIFNCKKNRLKNLHHLPEKLGPWGLNFARIHTDFGFWLTKGAIYPPELADKDYSDTPPPPSPGA